MQVEFLKLCTVRWLKTVDEYCRAVKGQSALDPTLFDEFRAVLPQINDVDAYKTGH